MNHSPIPMLLYPALIFFGLALAGCKTTEQALKENGAAPMTASAIRGLVTNKTVNGVSNDTGVTWTVYYDPNGEIRGKAHTSRGLDTDSGTWKATADDLLCLQFNKWRDGKLRCWQLYDQGGKLTWVGKKGPAKTSEDDDTWREGNVENL